MKNYKKLLLIVVLISPMIDLYAQLTVNQDRLEKRITELAQFGIQENGETERVAFSDADIAAQQWVISQLKEMSIETHIDFAGNVIGIRKGTDKTKKPISFGSHIDRVPHGGNYDGCVGSMATLEVLKVLDENNVKTKHPLEIIIFSNEEGGVVGSRAIAGQLKETAFAVKNSTGYSIGEGMMRLGGDTTSLAEVARKKGAVIGSSKIYHRSKRSSD